MGCINKAYAVWPGVSAHADPKAWTSWPSGHTDQLQRSMIDVDIDHYAAVGTSWTSDGRRWIQAL